MKYIKMYDIEDYIEESGDDCVDIGVKYVYVGVYDDGEDYEESSIVGYVYEDGMCEIVGCRMDRKCDFDENGIMRRGVILRHLVLPSLRHDSIKILKDVSERYNVNDFKLSLMCQYTPDFCPDTHKELKRKITTFEYTSVVDVARQLGYDGYIQDISSASAIYTPNFIEKE